MFNAASFFHRSLIPIVVEHVVLLPANLYETLTLFHCLVASSTMVPIIYRFVSLQLSLLLNWSSTILTASTGLRHFHCFNWSSTFSLFQLVFNISHCFNWSPTLYTASTGLLVKKSQCFKLKSYLTYINPKITCIFINSIISK